MRPSVAVVGGGYWGSKYVDTLVKSFPEMTVLLVEKDSLTQTQLKARFPSVRLYSTVHDLLNSTQVDHAIIATPARFHGELAVEFLQAGSSVLVEKPFLLSVEQLERVKSLDPEQSRVSSGYLYVHNPLIRAVKNLLQAETYGELLFIESLRKGFGAFRKDVNVIRDLMVHDFSLCLFLMENRDWTVTHAAQRLPLSTGFHGEAEAQILFAGGASAKLVASQFRPDKTRKMTFFFERAIVAVDEENEAHPFRVFVPPRGLLRSDNDRLWDGEEYAGLRESKPIGLIPESPRKSLHTAIDAFFNSAVGKEPNPANLDLALNVDAMARQVESVLSGRASF